MTHNVLLRMILEFSLVWTLYTGRARRYDTNHTFKSDVWLPTCTDGKCIKMTSKKGEKRGDTYPGELCFNGTDKVGQYTND